jgi:hypothetical protein
VTLQLITKSNIKLFCSVGQQRNSMSPMSKVSLDSLARRIDLKCKKE